MSEDPVAVLQRWTSSGAGWRVVGRHGDRLTIALLTCDGGEEVDRLESGDPRLLEYVGDAAGSDD